MSKRTITVAAAQTGPVLSDDDIGPGVREALAMIEAAAAKKAEVICFSELFLTPFFPNRLERDCAKWFMELPDPRVQPLLDAAKKANMALLLPYGERAGKLNYNSTAVFDRAGRHVGTYRKTHIPAIFPSNLKGGTGSYEKFYFTPGSAFGVYDLGGVKGGVQICYDRKYPEGSRALAIGGAEIIFMPICAASYGETKLRDNTWDLPLRARAYENGTFVVAVNRAGMEHGRRHLGQSMIINPIGAEIMAIASEEKPELLVATLDLADVATAQQSLPWWRDRRPEIYDSLTRG